MSLQMEGRVMGYIGREAKMIEVLPAEQPVLGPEPAIAGQPAPPGPAVVLPDQPEYEPVPS
jgi:hypothetical protein